MKDARQIAEEAALQSFLNCYIRETAAVEWLPAEEAAAGEAADGPAAGHVAVTGAAAGTAAANLSGAGAGTEPGTTSGVTAAAEGVAAGSAPRTSGSTAAQAAGTDAAVGAEAGVLAGIAPDTAASAIAGSAAGTAPEASAPTKAAADAAASAEAGHRLHTITHAADAARTEATWSNHPAHAAGASSAPVWPVSSPEGVYASCHLSRQGITLLAGVKHRSAVGRHLFEFPLYYRAADDRPWVAGDYVTVTTLLIKELALAAGGDVRTDELLLRVIQSCRSIEVFVAARSGDADELYGPESDFIAAEQSLLFGHLIHPTPKSRQGIPDEQLALYSPELKGSFALHYFRAARELVREDSTLPESATELVKRELREDPLADPAFVARYCGDDEWSLIPVHPLQAEKLLAEPFVQAWIAEGRLIDLGPCGSPYAATSSLRTVYREASRFMYKFSLQVKVTNSLRVNKFKELERGVEVDRLLATAVGEVCREFPAFDIVRDPAYLTLAAKGREESGFEVVLRANPFRGAAAEGATLVAGLVQDALPGNPTRLGGLIRGLAAKEGRSTDEVSRDWFSRYLDISLRPMVWLYMKFGIALEAHQQNSVVTVDADGYPHRFYYRDNQGYYFCTSTQNLLEALLPGIGQGSQTVCEDAVADERFRYYLIMNHMFGVINGFGSARLADERSLLGQLRSALADFVPMNREPSQFLHTLLHNPTLPCKANLLTRLHDMDELVGAMEAQSVYVEIDNPLVKEADARGFDPRQQLVAAARG
ncbi:IucA/IucC family siderophore biosynthesis protein [Paenibacillus athensensis]|uniref:IucA/IucC family siderophore biosynthesis protein n=2 Tax=Paenibacillus athensensis TaxID=1967502 RepID=A0A4Y8Q491_9BACL|nr:IucA/IucC family siderophore biosynthesis protein [Paenibacillus athensensis]